MGARDRDQSTGRLELHEARAAADGASKQWGDRQQCLGGALTGNPGIGSYIASKHGEAKNQKGLQHENAPTSKPVDGNYPRTNFCALPRFICVLTNANPG